LETGSLLHLGGNLGAPKGAEWVSEKDHPELGWSLGVSEEEDGDSTMRE